MEFSMRSWRKWFAVLAATLASSLCLYVATATATSGTWWGPAYMSAGHNDSGTYTTGYIDVEWVNRNVPDVLTTVAFIKGDGSWVCPQSDTSENGGCTNTAVGGINKKPYLGNPSASGYAVSGYIST